MARKNPPISGRDLIRHLPDLLTGRETAIDDPAIQRFITTDPEGRAAIGLIADTAAALTDAHGRLATHTFRDSSEVRDPVVVAHKYARRKLADLLFYEGMRRVQTALHARGDRFSLDYQWKESRWALDSKNALDSVDQLCAELRMRSLVAARLKTLLAITSRGDSRAAALQMRSAHHLLSADVALVPGRDGSLMMKHATADYSIARKSPSQWVKIAHSLEASVARGCALDRAMLCHVENGRWDDGCALVDEIDAIARNEPVIQSHVLLVALASGDERRMRRAGEALEFVAENNLDAWMVVRDPMVSSAKQLRRLSTGARREAIRLVSLLPAPLRALPWSFDR